MRIGTFEGMRRAHQRGDHQKQMHLECPQCGEHAKKHRQTKSQKLLADYNNGQAVLNRQVQDAVEHVAQLLLGFDILLDALHGDDGRVASGSRAAAAGDLKTVSKAASALNQVLENIEAEVESQQDIFEDLILELHSDSASSQLLSQEPAQYSQSQSASEE